MDFQFNELLFLNIETLYLKKKTEQKNVKRGVTENKKECKKRNEVKQSGRLMVEMILLSVSLDPVHRPHVR